MSRWKEGRALRILDFDLENRPLSYVADGYTTAEVTAIAWSWSGSDEVRCLLLTSSGRFVAENGKKIRAADALGLFVQEYDRADIVTGHYIRKHDLPLLNGALAELGLRPLAAKLTSDTMLDFTRKKDLSAGQEALAEMYGLPEPKRHMTQTAWRNANRLKPEGLEDARERVVGDVAQHKALRVAMLAHGHLKPPKVWAP